MTNLSVFILAAGLGERLRPITAYIPKPLLPILGKPVLEYILEKVSALPITAIGINLHYKKEAVEKWVRNSQFGERVVLFPEDPVLGTGGALKNAEGFLKKNIFLVHNADIVSDIDLENLIAFHISSGNLATLAVHDYPEFNRLILKGGFLNGALGHPKPFASVNPTEYAKGLPEGSQKILAFTGIAVYRPEFLQFLPEGNSSVVDAWFRAISAGYKIGTLDVTGCSWTDTGRPASYTKAVFEELKNIGETVYIHPSVQGCDNIEMDGYVIIEDASIVHDKLSLRNCIVLPGTEIGIERREGACSAPGTASVEDSFENSIIGPDFKIVLKETDLFNFSGDNAVAIGTGGSDRKYFRVKKNGRSVVLMKCPEGDADYDRHIELTLFFRKHSLPVPELIGRDPGRKMAVFEDAGGLSLYSWLKCRRAEDKQEEIYRKALDFLILLHTSVTEHVRECPSLQDRRFDYDHIRWETGYFVERFVKGVAGIQIGDAGALNDNFQSLALKVNSFSKTIVHRDFQSQNIMVRGGNPVVLDYQGARLGPPAYDIVSLLWDPYYRLSCSTRERLLSYYTGKMSADAQWFNEKEFGETLLPCRMQRHMQALGAYGFLSSVKGKNYFLKYIPEGLRLLREDLSAAKKEYPALDALVKKL